MDLAVLKKIGIIIKIQKKFKDSQHPPIITNCESQKGKVGSLVETLEAEEGEEVVAGGSSIRLLIRV